MPNIINKPQSSSSSMTSSSMSRSPAKPRMQEQKAELKEIPQNELDISTSKQFKFPSFNDITDWMVRPGGLLTSSLEGFINDTERNPFKKTWQEKKDNGADENSEEMKNLARLATLYGIEAEKNYNEALKNYNENEQWAATKWLGENLDLFDLATSPVSLGLLGPLKIAKMGPLARAVGEAGLQAGLEGIHSGVEGENIAGGVVAGGLSGLVPGGASALLNEASVNMGKKIPSIKFNDKQATRKEILEQAEEFMKQNKDIEKKIKGDLYHRGRLSRMKDGPLMTEAENKAYVESRIPESGPQEYVPADIRDESGKLIHSGEETSFNEIITDVGNDLTGRYSRGQLKSLKPTQAHGEPPLLSTILDEIPERLDPQGNPAYYWSDVVRGINNWTPKNEPERILKNALLDEYITEGNKLLPREKLLEEYPGLGLAALQPYYNAAADISREGLKDAAEGAYEQYEGAKGMYNYGKNMEKDVKELKEGLGILKRFIGK